MIYEENVPRWGARMYGGNTYYWGVKLQFRRRRCREEQPAELIYAEKS